MAIFGKKKGAEEILRMIAELPEEERSIVKSVLAGDAPENEDETPVETAEKETTEDEGGESAAVPEADVEAEPETEAEPDPELEATALEDEDAPDSTASDAEENAEEVLESDSVVEDRDLGVEIDELKETISALANRLDSILSKSEDSTEDDDEIGQAFGPDVTEAKKDEDDDLEKARLAAFGF